MSTQTAKRFMIQGSEQFGLSGEIQTVYNPADTVSEVGQCFQLTADQVELVERASVQSFRNYRGTHPSQRAEILNTLAGLLERQADKLARLITQESGKPISMARVEVQRAVALCRDYAAHVELATGAQMMGLDGRQARIQPFPVGPVLAITPYNFPLNLVMHKLAPAIATGCSITIKPAPQTPLTALRLGELAVEAGYDAINVVPASNEVSELLARSNAFAKLSFTGSARVGWHLRSIAGHKSVTLELGGNAAVVIEDVTEPLESLAERVAFGAFAFGGQTCISVQRILVNKRLLEDFQPALVSAIRAMRVGDPMREDTQVGPLISLEHLQKTRNVIKDAIFAGANVVYGGNTYNAFTLNPTLMDRTTPEMAVNREEVFAPVATLQAYETYEGALALVNDSEFGLQAGVYVNGADKIEQAYRTLEVGGVVINDIPGYRCDKLPYGGVKTSGLGKEGVLSGFQEYTVEKTLVVK